MPFSSYVRPLVLNWSMDQSVFLAFEENTENWLSIQWLEKRRSLPFVFVWKASNQPHCVVEWDAKSDLIAFVACGCPLEWDLSFTNVGLFRISSILMVMSIWLWTPWASLLASVPPYLILMHGTCSRAWYSMLWPVVYSVFTLCRSLLF